MVLHLRQVVLFLRGGTELKQHEGPRAVAPKQSPHSTTRPATPPVRTEALNQTRASKTVIEESLSTYVFRPTGLIALGESESDRLVCDAGW